MKNKEIERKFILTKFPKKYQENSIKQLITQGYLSENIRVRIIKEKNKEKAFLTLKRGSGIIREEFEENISLKLGRELMKEAHSIVKKIRFKFKNIDKKIWDVDFFPKQKIWLAEIELCNPKENFIPIDFIIKEVTENKKYQNKNLAIKKKHL